MKKTMTRTLALFLCCFLTLSSTGCSTDESLHGSDSSRTLPSNDSEDTAAKVDLMANFSAQEIAVEPTPISNDFLQAAADFSVKLFQQIESEPDEATDKVSGTEANQSQKSSGSKMISPLSVLTALSMTANGAAGETQKEMLEVLCGGMSLSDLNQNMISLQKQLPSNDGARLLQANSIWFRQQDIQVNPDFLQTNFLYYHADLFAAPFNSQTLKEINDWVSQHTEQRIPQILDEIPPNAFMYLINALAFDADWETPYKENEISDLDFTNADGSISIVPAMHSEENLYLEMDHATGFIKPYQGNYAFAALLPKEGLSVEELVNELTGDMLLSTLAQASDETVSASIPQFTSEYDTELSKVLKKMGMELPFDESLADFDNIVNSDKGNLFISRVIHKTSITVDENGTLAAAASAVEMRYKGMPEGHIVALNRPFIYLIIDQSTNLPIFMGTVTQLP